MFIGFTGSLGSGKTASMTFWGAYFAYKTGMPVYSNYALSMPREIKTQLIDSWDALTRITNGIVLLDELHITFDSRLWSNTAKRTHFLLQTRKKNLVVMFTTQHISQVDKRIRNICDYVLLCEKKAGQFRNSVIHFLTNELGRQLLLKNMRPVYDWYNTFEIVNYIK